MSYDSTLSGTVNAAYAGTARNSVTQTGTSLRVSSVVWKKEIAIVRVYYGLVQACVRDYKPCVHLCPNAFMA